jgi:hypothetical protein
VLVTGAARGGEQAAIEETLDACLLTPPEMQHFCRAVDADAVALDPAASPPRLVSLQP